MKPIFKRLLSGILSATMTVSAIPIVSAHAAESTEPYPYTIFAAANDDGAITINAENFCVNGNAATNGTIVSSGNMNINGTKTESADESMIFIFDKIDNQYFSTSDVEEHNEDYTLEELNININVPTEVQGETTLNGNININNALKALEDVNLLGEVKNSNDSVIFSEYGDIVIDSQNVNLNGLIYAPFGTVDITAQNLNLNNVIIIADSISLSCPSINANYNRNLANFVGIESEECPIIKVNKENLIYNADKDYYYVTSDFDALEGYLGKSDSFVSFTVEVYDVMDNLIYTNEIARNFRWKDENIGLMAGLNKVVLTAYQEDGTEYTYTMELMIDSSKFVDNLQVDLEDNDGDQLWNYMEIFLGTDPDKIDTDDDGLDDWTEIYVLGYNPIHSDTDGDGIIDGDEDEDGDSLTNAFEVNEFGSSPIASDTDNERLTDNEEYTYGTSPTMRDTDEDGISDYDEIYLFGLDPLIADPSDIQLTKTFTVDDMSGEYDDAVYPTLTLRGDVACIKNFAMSKMGRTALINPSAVGYLGAAYDFSTNGRFDGATLTFTYDPELVDAIDQSEENFQPAIYYFNEETCDIEEVPNQTWEGNQVTAELTHFSIYLLMNKKALEFYWNSELEIPDDAPVRDDVQVAFVLDKSESMDWNDPQNIRGQLTKEFCAQLEANDSVSIYGFSNGVTNYNSKKFISDRETAKNAVDKFINGINSGGTQIAVALDAVYKDMFKEKQNYEARNSNEKSSLKQYVFLLTDGVSFDTPSDDLLEDYKVAGIKIYTVGFGDADSMYLKRIADATKGKPYTADSTSDLNNIFLKFNDEIDVDENEDKISDYYEYLMCTGTLKTKTGTRVFDGYTYEEVMANNDLDGDGLINGKEVFVYTENFKPYVHMSSNPTRIYSDGDIYDDLEESQLGTSSNKVDFLIPQEDYTYLLNGSSFSFTKAANSYVNEFAGKLAFNYFVDVVFCGSESYFDTIKQGVQDGYYAVTGQGGKVGSENMLMKQDKALLAEYLGKIAELPDDQTQAENILEAFMETTDNALDFYDSAESVIQFAKDNDFEISDSVIKYLTDKKVQKLITDERREISRLQSELDLAKREARRNRTLTPEKTRDFANRQAEISRRQSDIDRNVFRDSNSPAIKERYENISKKAEFGLNVAQIAYSRISQFTELVKYSQQLAAFEQYRDFITELSECYDDYTAEAARQILKDLNSKEHSNYWGRGSFEFLMGTLSDAADLGLDVLIDKCGGEVTAVLQIAQFVISAVAGENLSYERENLISADLSTQITLLASDNIQSICGSSKKLDDGNRYYVASGAENCVSASQYMIYYVVTRQFGEEKYVELGEDRSGILGFFGYNTLVHKYGQSSVDNAKSNAESLGVMAVNYNRIFRES